MSPLHAQQHPLADAESPSDQSVRASPAAQSAPVAFRVRSAPTVLSGSSQAVHQAEAAVLRETILRRASATTAYNRRPLSGAGMPVEFVVCPCGQRNSSAAFFCSACKQSLASVRKQALAVCSTCGRRNSPSSQRCMQCKERLVSPRELNRLRDAQVEVDHVPIECEHCGHPNSKQSATCNQCFAVLPHRRPPKPCCPLM